jgi:hypothetical protein
MDLLTEGRMRTEKLIGRNKEGATRTGGTILEA